MEQVYAAGVSIIQFVQEWFADWPSYFEFFNNLTNPHNAFQVIMPVVATFDSVFAAQFILCMGFGSWLNTILKWWLLEDRPYWWVGETTYYGPVSADDCERRPELAQTSQTCETSPGSPSGHTSMATMEMMLALIWIAHVINDRKWTCHWWKWIAYPACAIGLISTILGRMFVAAHFPHQCLLGALIGAFLAPALCIFVCDPFIWQVNVVASQTRTTVACHTLIVAMLIAISFISYWTLKACGFDMQHSLKMALNWCNDPGAIRLHSSPLFGLVQSTGTLMGWALCVTPSVAKYRHYTQPRSLILASLASYLTFKGTQRLQRLVPLPDPRVYNFLQFAIYALKVPLFLRLVPLVAMWPFDRAPEVKRWSGIKLKNN